MKYELNYTDTFNDKIEKLSEQDQRLIVKTIEEKLRINPFYPSLRTKKLKGHVDLFESRINKDMRLIWYFDDDKIFLSNIGHHDILKRYG